MRLTSRKKKILSYFDPDILAWVTGEIGDRLLMWSGLPGLFMGWNLTINAITWNPRAARLKRWLKMGYWKR